MQTMTRKIEQFLDNIQMQSTLGKLLLPVIFLFFITMSVIYFGGGSAVALALVVAAMLAFYLAINIGANDVANNMGPAVGAKAITISGAILIAAIFEAAGAIIAGGDVVNTIKG